MSFEDLNKIQKYCDNQVDFDIFKEIMKDISIHDDYLLEKFGDYKKNPIRFLTSQGLENQFYKILENIRYKG